MIKLYTAGTPNGQKASIMLEECGLDYDVHALALGEDEQKRPDFLEINPNGRIPAIVDGDIKVFESGAILIYLAEKTGKLLPNTPQDRAAVMSWLMWQMGGLGPMAGQAYHFRNRDDDNTYALDRYVGEVRRLFSVMDGQLSRTAYLAGDDYSIADVACYAWTKAAMKMIEPTLPEGQSFAATNRWLNIVGERAAVKRGMAVPVKA